MNEFELGVDKHLRLMKGRHSKYLGLSHCSTSPMKFEQSIVICFDGVNKGRGKNFSASVVDVDKRRDP